MAISSAELNFVRELVYQRSAIVVEPEKAYLVEARLGPLARAEGFASIEAMIGRLRAQPPNGLHARVVEAMTTNETTFFRDAHPFDAMKSDVLPALQKARSASRTLRIWSAASSTGQEAYSLLMLLDQSFPELASWNVQVLGTDISEAAILRARSGVYQQIEINRGLPAHLLVKYFDRIDLNWQIKKALRDKVEFRQLNLIEPWPAMPQQDIVFLRNVLIYFDIPTKRAILERIRQVLAPDGYLLLGGAETTMGIDERFTRVHFGKSVFHRMGSEVVG